MADRPQPELQELIALVGRKKATAILKRAVRPQKSGQTLFLWLGIAVLIGGAVYIFASAFYSNDLPTAEKTPEGGAAEMTAAPVNPSSSVSAPKARAAVPGAALTSQVRPADFLRSIAVNGERFDFITISRVNLPSDGKPLLGYCLLRAQLDDATEKEWKTAGLLSDEPVITNPFLRKVKIRNAEALTYLYDWHVESISLEK